MIAMNRFSMENNFACPQSGPRINNFTKCQNETSIDQSSALVSDDEDSLSPLFEEPNTSHAQSTSSFLGHKRCHQDNHPAILHSDDMTSVQQMLDRCKSITHNLERQVACQIESIDVDKFFLDDQAVVFDDFSEQVDTLSPTIDLLLQPQSCRSAKRIKRNDFDETPRSIHDMATDKADQMESMRRSMERSAESLKILQEWDRKNGLPKSHSPTMVNSSRSREQLQCGMILQKWSGVPLLLLPGAKVKVTRRKFRGVKVAELEY